MSDPKKSEPDEELLEFLGGIDEANDASQDQDFSDFLAKADIGNLADRPTKPKAPAEGQETEGKDK
jgi:hypothetical protein